MAHSRRVSACYIHHTGAECWTACAHLPIQAVHQAAGRIYKLPNHARQLLCALNFAVNLRSRHSGGVVWRWLWLLLCSLCGVNERDLAGCLEYGAGTAIKGNRRFHAGLFGKAVECLFEGVGAVDLLVSAGG